MCSGHGHFFEVIFLRTLRPLVEHDVDDLRDDVAGALDHDGVADPDVAPIAQAFALVTDALDVILVVQRDVLHDHAADADRLELADRGEGAGAADLNLDVAQHRHGPLGREFVRNAPARRARDEAEPLLPVDAVDLVDHAVDVVVELGALLLDALVEGDQLLDRVAQLGQRIGLEAAALEPMDHAGLRRLRHRAHLAPGIGEETEGPRRRDGRILLPERARGRVARIGEDGIAGRFLPFVEREERLLGHVDLAAHLADIRDVAALQLLRHVFESADVGGDVLALRTVAARRRGDELAALIAQRHRQTVDLRLGGEIDLVVVELQEAHDAADKVAHVLFRKGVVERQHGHGVAHLPEPPRRCRADFL